VNQHLQAVALPVGEQPSCEASAPTCSVPGPLRRSPTFLHPVLGSHLELRRIRLSRYFKHP
jgi:hypothetical protein